jgi:DMSO/TMAO reductase YedYZ molybdopterin-dependent catalytic subunit
MPGAGNPLRPTLSRPVAALLGVLATAFGVAVGYLVAGLVQPDSSPFLAVGNTAIDLTPGPAKEFAIQTFGTSDKTALLLGMALVILVLAVVSGLLSRRDPRPGLALIGMSGLLGIAAVVVRPGFGALWLFAPIAAGIAGLGAFAWLHRTASGLAADSTGAVDELATSRRRFLRSSLIIAIAAGAAGLGGQFVTGRRNVQASRDAARRVIPALTPPIPPGADFAADGSPTFLTSNRDFYRVDTALTVPQIAADQWRLRVHGMVQRELVLGYDDLLRRRQVEKTITLACVSNEVGGNLISTAEFVGVPIRDVLLEAGVRPGTQQVISTSSDGFTAGTPVEVLLEPDRGALLAIGMNGEPLPFEHGFPVRMVTPGLYGYVSATKWLVDLELTTFDRVSYWQARGWAQQAPIKTESRIDRPRNLDRLPAGRTTAAGIAWAQHTGIKRVEVRVDGGPWLPAQLSTEVNTDTWRMWRIDLDLPPGGHGHTLECRATDRSGYTQTQLQAPPEPDGATGWHSILVTSG